MGAPHLGQAAQFRQDLSAAHGVKGNQHTGADHRAIGISHPQGIAPYRSRLFQTFNAALRGGARNPELTRQIRKGRARVLGQSLYQFFVDFVYMTVNTVKMTKISIIMYKLTIDYDGKNL